MCCDAIERCDGVEAGSKVATASEQGARLLQSVAVLSLLLAVVLTHRIHSMPLADSLTLARATSRATQCTCGCGFWRFDAAVPRRVLRSTRYVAQRAIALTQHSLTVCQPIHIHYTSIPQARVKDGWIRLDSRAAVSLTQRRTPNQPTRSRSRPATTTMAM